MSRETCIAAASFQLEQGSDVRSVEQALRALLGVEPTSPLVGALAMKATHLRLQSTPPAIARG